MRPELFETACKVIEAKLLHTDGSEARLEWNTVFFVIQGNTDLLVVHLDHMKRH